MLNLFLAPFQFPFMVNAIAISIVVAIPCALLSVFLVLKGWALMGDAMSHAVFPGVVLAYIIGIPFAIGAFIAGLLCAVTTGFLDDNSRLKRDTIMGIVFSGMFGAARGNTSLVAPLAWHPENRNAVIMVDLAGDMAPLLELDADALRERLYTPRAELGDLPAAPIKLVAITPPFRLSWCTSINVRCWLRPIPCARRMPTGWGSPFSAVWRMPSCCGRIRRCARR